MKAPVLIIAALLFLTACGGTAQQQSRSAPAAHASTATPMAGMPTPSPTPPGATPAPAVATDQVIISNFAFSPATITVKVGTTVTWTNHDQDAHTVSFRSGPEGKKTSQPMQMGDTYTFTFTKAGTVAYICSIHPYMHGTVEVTQ